MHAAAFCKVFTCDRSLYDRIHMSCITIRIMIATFTPVVAALPLLPSRGKFNPALGQIYPRATFTPAWCIRGMSFFKFTPAIPLGFVQTSGCCIRPLIVNCGICVSVSYVEQLSFKKQCRVLLELKGHIPHSFEWQITPFISEAYNNYWYNV